ncbi:hypothetical protein ETAA8_57850 [Anatilimnocola aggregata]|uniref:Uncharacterized protein n=1 Tax=Anatilimnocola aggregata TaxID=2528021 RepID=A0A517YK87_9BACT|nr:hypothetical protein [Anatilimnocola aggregata]QDU30639.1 hypothetical protein ETAA8_57850 [Anatilimnocola aggregata]
MLHEEVFQRLAVKHPEAVVVRATLEHALPPSLVNPPMPTNARDPRQNAPGVTQGRFC